jgi:hypothetical protein
MARRTRRGAVKAFLSACGHSPNTSPSWPSSAKSCSQEPLAAARHSGPGGLPAVPPRRLWSPRDPHRRRLAQRRAAHALPGRRAGPARAQGGAALRDPRQARGVIAKIAYHDYAISAERFHWQSQNAAGPQTPAGRRYLDSPGNGWGFQLFVRTAKASPIAPAARSRWSRPRATSR